MTNTTLLKNRRNIEYLYNIHTNIATGGCAGNISIGRLHEKARTSLRQDYKKPAAPLGSGGLLCTDEALPAETSGYLSSFICE